jgi:hypothetical protein
MRRPREDLTEDLIMSNLLFLRRSLAYRHLAAVELRKARALPPGPQRGEALRLARGYRDLARSEAWLEGQTPDICRMPRGERGRQRRATGQGLNYLITGNDAFRVIPEMIPPSP